MLYSQLGITQSIMEGSATEQEMENYYSRTIEPIVSAICDEFRRKFLTKTARSQGQDIMFFRNPFKLVPAPQLAEIAGKLISSEILTKNEVRAQFGYAPSDDETADRLSNPNITKASDFMDPAMGDVGMDENYIAEEENQNGI